jgi:hypothetical protein
MPLPPAATPEKIAGYCTCAGDYMAFHSTEAELWSIAASGVVPGDKADAADRACWQQTMRSADERIARRKFTVHKYGAKQRGIGFEFTFGEWWGIWLSSGHWGERGCRKDQYCMARNGDTGPYAVGNVRIITNEENRKEYVFTEEHLAKVRGSIRPKTSAANARRIWTSTARHAAESRAREILAELHSRRPAPGAEVWWRSPSRRT